MIKISSGFLKNFKLEVVPEAPIRPTSSKIRAALFNRLGQDIEDAHFWDFCAGTGAVGLEALSRGARFVGLVEKDKKAAQALIQIKPKIFERLLSAGCEKEPRLTIVHAALDLRTCNSLLDASGQAHTVIFFFDPPYNEFLPFFRTFCR